MSTELIAHIYQDTSNTQWMLQPYEAHQKGVATLAKEFGNNFECGDLCYVMGMLHDEGKKQKDFQKYIRKVSGYMPEIHLHSHPNHAYIGALLAKNILPGFKSILYPPIYSHHAGLKDDYNNDVEIPSADNFVEPLIKEIQRPTLPSYAKSFERRDIHHFQRMLYSCLVDADFLDTETFMQHGHSRKEYIGQQKSIPELLDILENHLENIRLNSADTAVNKIRQQVQEECRRSAIQPQGCYSLTVPTGGGKTLSGLLWALRHAAKYQLNRVIIAIPYTSIIVQTAQVLRNIFGDSNVLEHHSAFDIEKIAEQDSEIDINESARKQRLASENWDYPIVVTTNVQLFQSMMASKPSKCRKLHNIARSVIVLDEAQMLPREHLQPIIDSLDTYRRIFSCSVLFTTASQPVLSNDKLKTLQGNTLKGLDNVTEIIPQDMQLHDKLRRVELHFDNDYSSYDDIAERIMKYDRVLCVVSTRKAAMEIFSRLPQSDDNYHLSRMMCSAHLSDTLNQIRKALNSPNRKVRVVSTQLIEAGVDVDFPVVMRQESGLDSILQAAGRCNREGIAAIGHTYVFKFEQPLPRGFLSNANDARKHMTDKDWDWFSPEAMTEYFIQLFSRTETFDKAETKELLYDPFCINFETASEEFKLIEDNGISVIVNYADSFNLVEKAKHSMLTYKERKILSQYAVTIFERDFKELVKAGLIEEVVKGLFFVNERAQYSNASGLSTENHWLDEILIK